MIKYHFAVTHGRVVSAYRPNCFQLPVMSFQKSIRADRRNRDRFCKVNPCCGRRDGCSCLWFIIVGYVLYTYWLIIVLVGGFYMGTNFCKWRKPDAMRVERLTHRIGSHACSQAIISQGLYLLSILSYACVHICLVAMIVIAGKTTYPQALLVPFRRGERV